MRENRIQCIATDVAHARKSTRRPSFPTEEPGPGLGQVREEPGLGQERGQPREPVREPVRGPYRQPEPLSQHPHQR